MLELEGQELTAIVTSKHPNAFAIYRLIDEYALKADILVNLIEFAEGGMLKLPILARDKTTLHFNFEDLMLVTLDIVNSGRSAFLCEVQF